MKNKKLKSLLQLKQKIISREKGYPSLNSGRDGDFQIRRLSGQGVFLFYKWNNRWYQTRLSLYTPRTAQHKDKVKIPIGVNPSSPGELSISKTGYLKLSRGSNVSKQVVQMDSSKILDVSEIQFARTTAAETGGAANATADMFIKNSGAGHAQLHIQVLHDDADAYVRFTQFDIDPSEKLKQWVIGMDGSQSHRLSFVSRQTGTEPLTP